MSDAPTTRLSVVRNTRPTGNNPDALLTKMFWRSGSGAVESMTYCVLVGGDLRVVEVTPHRLAELIGSLTPRDALMFGVPKGGATKTPIVSRRERETGAPGITRTNEEIGFPEGGGVLFLDFDRLPDGIADVSDIPRFLASVEPAFDRVPMVVVPSASSNVRDSESGEMVRDLRGVHAYVFIERAGDAPEIGKRLRARMILEGHGWCFVSKAGWAQVRVPIDTTVFQPVRLVFAAGAKCEPPLVQDREPVVFSADGAPLSLASIPDLTAEERSRVEDLEKEISGKNRQKIETARAEYRQERLDAGVSPEALDRMLDRQELEGDFPIHLADGPVVTVADILADPERFDGCECYDPEEPEYDGGRVVGRIYARNDDGMPRIHSFAHGRRVYALVRDAKSAASAAQSAFTALPLYPFSQVETVPIEWLLKGRLARREITMVNGWPGEGKTSLVITMVAALTRGAALPDDSAPPRPLNVLFLSTEDNDSVLKLRLMAAGADMDKVFTLPEDEIERMRLPSGHDRWKQYIRVYGIDVVAVDPMMAFLDDALRNIAEQDARKFMQALRAVLLETNAAAICIRHPNKASAGGHMNAVSASSGSLAFTAAARIEMLVGRTPDSDDVRALVSVKNNLAAAPPALLYRIESALIELWADGPVDQDVAVVRWAGVDDEITADDLLTRRESREVRTKLAEAKQFLENYLRNGPAKKTDVVKVAKAQGIAEKTLDRARQQIGWSEIHGNLRYSGFAVWGLNGQSMDDLCSEAKDEVA